MALNLTLVTPEKQLLDTPVELVVIPGQMGDMGVMEGHAPVMTALRAGLVTVYQGETVKNRYFVRGGFAEIGPDRCRVLAEDAANLNEMKKSDTQAKLMAARAELDKALGKADPADIARLENAVADAELLDSLVH